MSCELDVGTIIKDIQGEEYKIIRKLSEGAQGQIYEVGNHKIVKINYDKNNNREKILRQLYWIMKQNIPAEARIAQPIAIIDEPYTGYIMKKVPEEYEPLSKYINFNSNYTFSEWFNDITGGLKKRLQIGVLLAKSLRSLHFEGLTYCDVSPANILVSPKKNSIAIIDADNLMATEVFTADIIGTPGYIAPELYSESRQPNSLSDVYSFAVLIFEMLCMGHPLVGDTILEDTPEAEEEAKRGESVYVNHPTDDSNRNSRVSALMILLTDLIKSLFEQTFIKGLHNPSSRPSLKEYGDALEEALDQLVVCKNPDCGGAFLYESDKGMRCPFCKHVEDSVDHLKFYRKINVKEFELSDYRNIGEMKQLEPVIDNSYTVVINKEVTYIRKRHFDYNIHERANDKVLKLMKLGAKTYEIAAIDDTLPLYIKRRGKSAVLMKSGMNYDFIYNNTAILFKPNSNLIDGSELKMDSYKTGCNSVGESDVNIVEYVAIYY